MLKLIFLDFDGVLATGRTIKNGLYALDDDCLENLRILLKETNAKIVVSSSWRTNDFESTIQYMNDKMFPYTNDIIGITIRLYHYIKSEINISWPRGLEIKYWLDINMKNKEYQYLILDDDRDMLYEQKDNFIYINRELGLTKKDILKGINILNNKSNI